MSQSGRFLYRAAWLAVLLGIVIEALLLAIAAGFGALKGVSPAVADLTQKVSWSLFVCVGVALGTALAKGRAAVAGWIGFVSGPVAFQGAKVAHKAVTQALAVPAGGGGLSPGWIALWKGVEYGVLGALLAWIGKSARRAPSDYVFAGLLTGILGGGALSIAFLARTPAPIPPVAIVSRFANEILQPVGCALVVFAAENLGKPKTG